MRSLPEVVGSISNTPVIDIVCPAATPYGANTVVGGTTGILPDCAYNAGSDVMVTATNLRIDVASIPSGMSTFKLHVYNEEPTSIANGAAFNLIAADRDKYLGYIRLNVPIQLGDTGWSQSSGLVQQFKLKQGSTTLYCILTTDDAYTPTAGTKIKISLKALQV